MMFVDCARATAWSVAVVAAVSGAPLQAAEQGPAARASAPWVETQARVIVKFRAGSGLMQPLSAGAVAAPQQAQALATRLGVPLTDGRAIGPRMQVVKAQGLTSRELADRLSAQPDIEYAVIDGRMQALALPNDPYYSSGQASPLPASGQWYLRPPTASTIVDDTSILASINAPAAWAITTGSASVVVANLDTGIRADHPDLAGKILPGYDFVSDLTTANDGTAADADPSDPGDYGCTAGSTSSWHGTKTAGLIGAATNNGTGIASIGWNVMLLPVRVLGRCGGSDSDIQAAMLWAAGLSSSPTVNTHPARVINMSLGAPGACTVAYLDIMNQLNAAGVVVVVAAGNQGVAVGTPANCVGLDSNGQRYGAIAVAGVRHAGTKVAYSDLGSEIAIAAPAGNCVNSSGPCLFPIMTTSNSGTTAPVPGAAGATYTGSALGDASLGTSFSSPLVAGTVALMFSANPALRPLEVFSALQRTARPFPATGPDPSIRACAVPGGSGQSIECYCTTGTCGAGLLDAGAAVAAVTSATANIGVASTNAVAGTSVTLDASGSRPSGGGIASYAWTITGGTGAATFTSATNAVTATLLPSAAGTVVVGLTVIDGAGLRASTSVTLTVAAAPPPVPTPVPSNGGGGGGGALAPVWLLGWLAAALAMWLATPRRRRP
jgi:serine protease